MGREIDAREKIVNFIPEYASYSMNRLEVGKDGKVAYDRAKGKKPTVLGWSLGRNSYTKRNQQLSWKR